MSPIAVTCGKAGTLTTHFSVIAAEPEMSLAEAAKVICERTPARVKARYGTELPAMTSFRKLGDGMYCSWRVTQPGYSLGEFNGSYGLVISTGTLPCTFNVDAGLRTRLRMTAAAF
jgi:hypothetical protein